MSTENAVGKPARKRVTSADIARASGVSRATVSYVLNDAPGKVVSASTRELVLKTARELGHYPFAPARSLRLGRSNIVLAIVRDFSLGYTADKILERLDVELAAHGYLVLAHRYDAKVRPLQELWGLVSPAVIVAMGNLSVPDQIVIEDSPAMLMRVQGLLPNHKAGEMQVEYLYGKGHRVIGYAFPSSEARALTAHERYDGARDACARLGIPEPVLCEIDTNDTDTVFQALDVWQAPGSEITAICAHNDEIAIMIDAALASRGSRSGEGLALIGMDNIPTARIALTTIAINTESLADHVAQHVIALLEDRDPPPVHDNFLTLIERATA
jgi:DNA-binding LacI/PurR family transcriptional regulator